MPRGSRKDEEHETAKAGRGYTAKNQRKPIPVSPAVEGRERGWGFWAGESS